ncbi:MAG: TerB family tellurite resistance protein [Rhodospirillales bacterium]|nr:TerB family tellurite resistance protein [Rhodospirillales bacterium]MBO6787667.1 TerB family tellurite resistance protein [Rhodospirillales bacterium]
MQPLDILATAIAYVIAADGQTTVEEKAKLISMLGKHVSNGDLTQDELQKMTQSAFNNAEKIPVDKFLTVVGGNLSQGQKAVLLLNMYDVAAVDGSIALGEKRIIEAFEEALEIDQASMFKARDMIAYKNDTAVFTNTLHPKNDPTHNFYV